MPVAEIENIEIPTTDFDVTVIIAFCISCLWRFGDFKIMSAPSDQTHVPCTFVTQVMCHAIFVCHIISIYYLKLLLFKDPGSSEFKIQDQSSNIVKNILITCLCN